MKEDIFAIITGDLVDSTAIAGDYKAELYQVADDIKQYQAPDFIFDIYRGDSFQALIHDPSKALLIGILMRAGLRRKARGSGLDDIWDARLAIGIGEIDQLNIGPEIKLGTLGGEAFIRSGRTLDNMKKEGALLKIKTGDDQLDEEFDAVFPLVDTIIGRWSTAQAEAIYWHLLDNLTQKEIGKRLNKSQRAISKRLETSSIESMSKLFKRFEKLIAWKYNS